VFTDFPPIVHSFQHQQVKASCLKALVKQKIIDLEKGIKECFQPIEQPLKEGVEQAKQLYKENIQKILFVSITQFIWNSRGIYFGEDPWRSAVMADTDTRSGWPRPCPGSFENLQGGSLCRAGWHRGPKTSQLSGMSLILAGCGEG